MMRRTMLLVPWMLTSCVYLNSSPGIEPTAQDENTPAVQSTPPTPAPITPTPADANRPDSGPTVRFMGRFDQTDPNNVVFALSGSTIITRFEGSTLDILLSEDENATYGGVAVDNYYDVFIDGALSDSFGVTHGVTHGDGVYRITPANLAYGDHYVWVVKRTEAQIGGAVFSGFVPRDGKLLPAPLPHNRRIEFIGDSITCGYGVTQEADYTDMCHFSDDTENADKTYAWLTGQALGADTVQVSFSGKGVVQNVDPASDPYWTMPLLYGYTDPQDRALPWDFSSWTPDVVVIVLGGNDYFDANTGGNVPAPTDANFIAGYQSLIEQVRKNYPKAHIVCGLGPMLSGDALQTCASNINTAIAALQAKGDNKLSFIAFPADISPLPAGYGTAFGCDYHPDATTQKAMSALLVQQIKAKMNW